MSKPNIILFDIETSPVKVTTFSLYPNSIHHSNVIKDWHIFTICWKKLGEKRVHSVSLTDDPTRFKKDHADDFYVVSEFAKVLREADAIIGHNIDKFDVKKFNTRLIYHKMKPVPKIHQIDTLKMWKKIASATSNRLDYLGKYLGFGQKTHTSEGLWMRALDGEAKAIKEMTNYCKNDVVILEELYTRIAPYAVGHPHLGAIAGKDRKESCPNCGGSDLVNSKTRYSAAGVERVQKQCKSCHAYSTHTN